MTMKNSHSIPRELKKAVEALGVDKVNVGASTGKTHGRPVGTIKIQSKILGGFRAVGYTSSGVIDLVLLTDKELM